MQWTTSVTVTYTCQFTHNLYIGTSLNGTTSPAAGLVVVNDTLYNPSLDGNLYSDRGVAGIKLDGDTETMLDCRVNTVGSALVTRRLLRTAVAPGKHTVVIRVAEAGFVYFDFLEAAVLSDVPEPADAAHQHLSRARFRYQSDLQGLARAPALDVAATGLRRPDQRIPRGVLVEPAHGGRRFRFHRPGHLWRHVCQWRFDHPRIQSAHRHQLGKSVFPTDTPGTIALHFADYINSSLTSSWASATTSGVLTITGRSPALPYNLVLSAVVTSTLGTAAIAFTAPAGGRLPHVDRR